jgi:toxin ParE1/3/4
MAYSLSHKAEDDLIAIYVAGAERFGSAQAERYYAGMEQAFDMLAQFPHATSERTEIDPPVRVHPYRAHLIVYLIDAADIYVLRIRHGREDWIGDA